MTPRRLLHRLLALVRSDRLDRELDGEIQAHLELAERDAMAAGMTPEEARRSARLRFGHIDSMKEAHRDHRSARWIEHLLRDLRYGLASLARNPGFTGITIGILALGIGANTAMFSVLDVVLLKPLPFPAPERIVRIYETPRPGAMNSTSALDFLDWKRLSRSFEALAAENPSSAAWTGHGDPVRLTGKRVTANYFAVFTTTPHIGRTFLPQDDHPGAAPVVVISHAVWQAYFGEDPGVLRRTMVLDGVAHDVVGVLPPGTFGGETAFWKPLVFAPDELRRDWHWLVVSGRLRPDVTLAQAQEELDAIDVALSDVVPFWKRDWSITAERFDRLLVGDLLRQSILVAFGAVVAVLLIACANVTNLLLARGVSRQKEMAVRAALGASRPRLVAQLLAEGFALCLLGAIAGLVVAALLIAAATPVLGELVPSGLRFGIDLRVLAFTAVAALGVSLLIGMVPSLTLSIDHLSQALSRTSRGLTGGRGRMRRAVVIAEVALSLVLVCSAGLLFRSLFNLRVIDTGVRIDHVITASVHLPESGYATSEATAGFYERAIEEIESVPGVVRAATSTDLPLHWIGAGEALFVPGLEAPVSVRLKRVDAGYFRALDIPVMAGRGITSRDRAGSTPVIVINDALARALNERGVRTLVGQRARLTLPEGDLDAVQIAGVIRNERVTVPGRPDPPVVYVPLAQAPVHGVQLIVRTQIDPVSLVPGIREAIERVDPHLPLADVATMEQVRDETLSFASQPAWVIGIFAAVAALLAALGIYGVIAHSVTERTREIGIRIALGARQQDVVSQVLRDALWMVAGGLVAGLAGTILVTRSMEGLLFQVKPLDPLAIALACGSMIAVGVLAALVPATRAASVPPISVLRNEG